MINKYLLKYTKTEQICHCEPKAKQSSRLACHPEALAEGSSKNESGFFASLRMAV